DRSVTSRRTMQEIAGAVAPETWHSSKPGRPAIAGRPAVGDRPAPAPRKRKSGRSAPLPAPLPDKARVTLATLVDEPPEGEAWMHEIKFDGYRILARVSGEDVVLWSRNGLDWTARFPALAAELAGLDIEAALLDGEVVAYGPDGISDFGALQKALSEHDDAKLTYMVFDLLFAGGEDLRPLPLAERKARLGELLGDGRTGGSRPIRLSEHVAGSGGAIHAEACRLGLEGVVSKRADSSYAGRRSRSWLKSKCGRRQEFVVGGYTTPRAAGPGSAPSSWACTTTTACATPARSAPGSATRSSGASRSASAVGARVLAVRRRSQGARGSLGHAEAGRGGRVRGLDGGRALAPGGVQGRA
ncbi:MAG: hypothetical protein EHM52_02390, partial [Actinomycetota bacterium]